jgi:hypothetical protein
MPTKEWKSGCQCKHLEGLFSKWAELHEEYTGALANAGADDGHGWWTNERANIGFIAAAAWKLGGVALEEYPARSVAHEEFVTGFLPRVDLYAQVNLENELRYIIFESKMYIAYGNVQDDNLTNGLNRNLDLAEEQFNRLHHDEKGDCELYAVCFLMLKFGCNNRPENVIGRIHGLYDSLGGHRAQTLFIQTYIVDQPPIYDEHIYPGIVVFGRRLPDRQ